MLVYFAILFVVLILVFASNNVGAYSTFETIIFYSSAIVLVLFAGFRANVVGTDTNNYISMFIAKSNQEQSIFEIQGNIEIGYLFLQQVAYFVSTKYWSILTLIALISVIPTYYVLRELTQNVIISIFIYITLGIYLLFFNAGRQGISVAISTVGILYILDRSLVKYLICIFIASLFHKTAIIMIPFYFIITLPFSTKRVLLFLVIGFFSFYFLSTILSVISPDVESRYGVYEDRGATGGFLLAAFFIIVTLLFIGFRNEISEENIYLFDIYLNLAIFTGIIYLVVILTGSDVNFIRITNYFAIGYALIWPIIFEDVRFFKSNGVKFGFVLVHLLFFAVYLSKMSNLVPYEINEIFSKWL
jgi:hypothetical protein